MYRSIVVGTDGSAGARLALLRAAAVAAAGHQRAAVHVVSAFQPLTDAQVAQLRQALPAPFQHEVQPDMGPRAALAEASELLAAADIEFLAYDPPGQPAEAILAVAAEVGADLVLVGSHGLSRSAGNGSGYGAESGLSGPPMGQVTARLVLDSPVDILVVRNSIPAEPEGDQADADHDHETVTSAFGRLSEAAGKFEAGHPDLVRTVSDVSYYLSGLGL